MSVAPLGAATLAIPAATGVLSLSREPLKYASDVDYLLA
jgi:hypothetical protein